MSNARQRKHNAALLALAAAGDRLAAALERIAVALEARTAPASPAATARPPKKASKAQLDKIGELCLTRNIGAKTIAEVVKGYHHNKIEDLTVAEASEVIDRILGKRLPAIKGEAA